jgi:putative FmdB family regulatory protein
LPIYEYECKVCGHKLEKLQKISDEPLKDCPACEEPGLHKLVSAVVFRLKGGGWYETDFKDEKSRRNVAKEDDKGAESAAGKSTGAEQKKNVNGKTAEDTGVTKETKAATKADSGSTATSTPAG